MKPWNIAICDDDEIFCTRFADRIQEELDRIGLEGEITTYSDGHGLLECQEKPIDILFLDIDMPEITGMDIAEFMRKQNPEAELIFVSNYSELVFEAIRYQPFRFLRKEHLQEELSEALLCLKEKKQEKPKTIELLVERNPLILAIEDVVFVESRAHYLYFHMTDRSGAKQILRSRGKISDYIQILQPPDFLSPAKSFLVNCSKIKEFSLRELVVKTGERIAVSRDRKVQIQQQYMDYMRSKIRGMD